MSASAASEGNPLDPNKLGSFSREMKALLKLMAEQGWTARLTAGGALCKAPDGVTTMRVPHRTGEPRALRNVRAEFARWERNQTPKPPAKALMSYLPRPSDSDIRNDVTKDVLTAAKHRAETVIAAGVEQGRLDPTLVSSVPWLAHSHKASARSPGMRYESQTTLERTWSDGSIDYQCSKCDYEAPKPRSVTAHYAGRHASKDQPLTRPPKEALIPDAAYTENIAGNRHHPDYSPSERLIRALADYIEQHADHDLLPSEMATLALAWMHERPDLPMAPEQATVAPLSPEQILERVAALVGQPFASRVAALEEQAAATQALLAQVTDERDSLASDMAALHELTANARRA